MVRAYYISCIRDTKDNIIGYRIKDYNGIERD